VAIPVGKVVYEGSRKGVVIAHRPKEMVDVKFKGSRHIERRPVAKLSTTRSNPRKKLPQGTYLWVIDSRTGKKETVRGPFYRRGQGSKYAKVYTLLQRKYPNAEIHPVHSEEPRQHLRYAMGYNNPKKMYDPMEEQNRAVMQGMYETAVKKALGLKASANFKPGGVRLDVKALQQRKLSLAQLKRIQTGAFRMRTGVGQRLGHIQQGAQRPTKAGRKKALERYQDAEHLAQNRQDYETTLGLFRKGGFYRWVPELRGGKTVYVVQPGDQVVRSEAAAVKKVNALNAKGIPWKLLGAGKMAAPKVQRPKPVTGPTRKPRKPRREAKPRSTAARAVASAGAYKMKKVQHRGREAWQVKGPNYDNYFFSQKKAESMMDAFAWAGGVKSNPASRGDVAALTGQVAYAMLQQVLGTHPGGGPNWQKFEDMSTAERRKAIRAYAKQTQNLPAEGPGHPLAALRKAVQGKNEGIDNFSEAIIEAGQKRLSMEEFAGMRGQVIQQGVPVQVKERGARPSGKRKEMGGIYDTAQAGVFITKDSNSPDGFAYHLMLPKKGYTIAVTETQAARQAKEGEAPLKYQWIATLSRYAVGRKTKAILENEFGGDKAAMAADVDVTVQELERYLNADKLTEGEWRKAKGPGAKKYRAWSSSEKGESRLVSGTKRVAKKHPTMWYDVRELPLVKDYKRVTPVDKMRLYFTPRTHPSEGRRMSKEERRDPHLTWAYNKDLTEKIVGRIWDPVEAKRVRTGTADVAIYTTYDPALFEDTRRFWNAPATPAVSQQLAAAARRLEGAGKAVDEVKEMKGRFRGRVKQLRGAEKKAYGKVQRFLQQAEDEYNALLAAEERHKASLSESERAYPLRWSAIQDLPVKTIEQSGWYEQFGAPSSAQMKEMARLTKEHKYQQRAAEYRAEKLSKRGAALAEAAVAAEEGVAHQSPEEVFDLLFLSS